jgi:flagellar motor component MotA
MAVERLIGLATVFGLVAVIIYVGLLFYEKNQAMSVILIVVGLIVAIYVIVSETEFKRRRHEAPWLFDEYKGE